MDYFSKFLRTNRPPLQKVAFDHALEFHKSWNLIKNTLLSPDERQLAKGIKSTDVPAHLKSLVDSLVWEFARTEDGDTGACLEYLLKHDVLGTLVQLSEADRPFGIQAEVLRAVQNMVVLLDEQFLVHSAVHRAVLRLLRNCVGDDMHEQLWRDGRNKVMGAARNSTRSQPSEYEEDLVNLLCILCSRIRTHRELLMIFFHDKNWLHHESLSAVVEGSGDEDEDGDANTEADDTDESEETKLRTVTESHRIHRPASRASQATVTSAPAKKQEYEFLLFNYLLRFVHREGQIGDFARAGLLFLVDVAMSPHGPVNKVKNDRLSTGRSSPDAVTDAALALAEYILDGDFSEVLGAGLCAVYSLLPSKLEFRPRPVSDANPSTGMILGNGILGTEGDKELDELHREKKRMIGLEDASNPDFRSRLDHFLKLLEFLQDVIRRNVIHDSPNSILDAATPVGTAIVQSILDAVQAIFLENILYPSILECSDADGSAVAVMSYIEIMIRTLPEGQLSDLLVNFLTSEDNDEIRRQPRDQPMLTLKGDVDPNTQPKLQRRKSSAMMLLEIEAPESRRPSEYFTTMGRFTLKDLLVSNLRSNFQPAATAALQLFDSLLRQHPQLCTDKLLLIIPDDHATSFPSPPLIHALGDPTRPIFHDTDDIGTGTFTYPGAEGESIGDRHHTPAASSGPIFLQPKLSFATHEREMDLYLALVSRVDPSHSSEAFSTGYEHYLHDAICTISESNAFLYDGPTESRKYLKHRLNPSDPFLSMLLESLRRFFSNTPEFNVALTGVLATLATHPDRSLAGWLTFVLDNNDYSHDDSSDALEYPDDSDDRSVDFQVEQLRILGPEPLPTTCLTEESRPVIHSILQNLVGQIEQYRRAIPDFDRFLLERRQGLLFSENLTDALTLALDITDEPNPGPPPETPAPQPKAKVKAPSSFVSFLTPRKKSKPSSMPSEPITPPRSKKKLAASPFGPHYEKTSAIVVEPFVAPIPSSSSWTPAKPTQWATDIEDVFSSSIQWGETTGAMRRDDDAITDAGQVTLSHVLDNVVILEEAIKELVAIVHARRSLGIDAVRYV